MDQQQSGNQGFLRNDRRLVCGMFVFYGICILGLVAVTFWGLNRRSLAISVNATSTAFARATERAYGTATMIAHITEQAHYTFVERFDNNRQQWSTASLNDEYMSGSISIKEGAYVWNIQKVKKPFVHWENFPAGRWVGDFDIYVDSRIEAADDTASTACSGFVFRAASDDWEKGTYIFSVCDAYFVVHYYAQGKWEDISDRLRTGAIHTSDWNRLEISARGSRFTFLINQQVVYEMTDDRLPRGGLALFADINEEKPVTVRFDNFGFQSR